MDTSFSTSAGGDNAWSLDECARWAKDNAFESIRLSTSGIADSDKVLKEGPDEIKNTLEANNVYLAALSAHNNLLPILGEDGLLKKLTFTHWGKKYTASVHINRFIAAFFTDYPQTAFDVYFSAPLSDRTQKELIPALKDLVHGMSEKEAANFILHFVQTAFAYQTDEAQFNREKPLFPEETLYYPASDCEDRSVLFSYLVRHVLNLDVIGLDYPSHMATAVRFNEAVPGMRVRYDGKTYVICDPTFINADIGRPIPQVQQVTPKVIWGS